MTARDTYLMDPAEMTDEEIDRWILNFREQPPTLDSIVEHSWAGRVAAEFQKRIEQREQVDVARAEAPHSVCHRGLGHLVDDRLPRRGLFLSDLPCSHWIQYVRDLEAQVAAKKEAT